MENLKNLGLKAALTTTSDYEPGYPKVTRVDKNISFRRCADAIEIILEIIRWYGPDRVKTTLESYCIPYEAEAIGTIKKIFS